jgi:hypothetical protein
MMWRMDNVFLNSVPAWLLIILIIWSLIWKGLALWKAAQLSHKKWFILILVLNTFGILDIIYLQFVAKKFTVETVESK